MTALAIAFLGLAGWTVIAVIVAVVFILVVLVFVVMAVMPAWLPSLIIQIPATMILTPFRAMVDIARTGSNPVALRPYMLVAVPVPVTRCPDITIAWRRYALITKRWRGSADIHADADLCRCLQGQYDTAGDSNCGQGQD